jgi:5,10-methylene-tetrahydrofolate dehydrogenase/methenyl tetrahydrofolate cyclohydrolase
MNRIGSKLLANAKATIYATSKSNVVEKSDVVGRDLLSLLVKANMATDLKEEHKMSDEDVIARACVSC